MRDSSQKPHPPIWMAALSEETFALAGRYGLNLLYGSVFGLWPDVAGERGEGALVGRCDAGRSTLCQASGHGWGALSAQAL